MCECKQCELQPQQQSPIDYSMLNNDNNNNNNDVNDVDADVELEFDLDELIDIDNSIDIDEKSDTSDDENVIETKEDGPITFIPFCDRNFAVKTEVNDQNDTNQTTRCDNTLMKMLVCTVCGQHNVCSSNELQTSNQNETVVTSLTASKHKQQQKQSKQQKKQHAVSKPKKRKRLRANNEQHHQQQQQQQIIIIPVFQCQICKVTFHKVCLLLFAKSCYCCYCYCYCCDRCDWC